MLTLPGSVRIYLAIDPVDLRRGHDGLSAIAQGQWGWTCSKAICSCSSADAATVARSSSGIRGGLVFYYKRLEQGRFRIPKVATDGRSAQLDATELAMILNGMDVRTVHRPDHWRPSTKKTLCRMRRGSTSRTECEQS